MRRSARVAALAVLLLSVAAPPAAAATAHVHIENFLYSPVTVTIVAGDTVMWHNHDSSPHTATRTATPGAFDTGNIDPGETKAITFGVAGTYDYFCAYHVNMVGTVRVNPAPPPPNRAPDAAIAYSTEGLVLAVDGTDSTDPDGDELTYSWTWGDGTPAGTEATMSHTYAEAGTYTLRLTVSDGDLSDPEQVSVMVSPANRAPVASFTAQISDLVVATNASGSTDPDGDVLTFSWDWGDGSPSTAGETASHTYGAAGNYTIELRATDGALTATSQQVVQLAPANRAPVASFVAVMARLDLTVNASASSDPDGDALTFSWDWGDGSEPGGELVATHAYAARGNYTVRLNVSDGRGLFAQSTQQVTAEHANRAPLADFAYVLDGPLLTVDASNSTDPDGDALTFSWDWGDGSAPGAGRNASHTFAAPGDFPVRLIVRDATAASLKERIVTVAAAAENDTASPVAPTPPANTAPTLTLTSGALRASVPLGASLTWEGSATDPDGDNVSVRAGIVGGTDGGRREDEPQFEKNGTLSIAGAWRLVWTPRTLGDHVVEVLASDGAHDSEPLRLRVSVRENAPPAALPVLPAGVPLMNGSTTLEGVWSDPEKMAVRVEVAFANGTWRPAQVRADGMWQLDWNASEYPPGPLAFSVRVSDEVTTVVEGPYTVRVEGVAAPSPEDVPVGAAATNASADPDVASAPVPGAPGWMPALVLAALARMHASRRARN